MTQQQVPVGSALPRPERNRQPPLGERRLIVGQCNPLVTLFNKSARPGLLVICIFRLRNRPLRHRVYQKRQHQPRCDFVDGFDCERRCARRARASPTWNCPGLPLRARGIARRWNREGFGATANPAKSRWPRHIFADGGEQAFAGRRVDASPCNPRLRARRADVSWSEPLLGLRRCRCDTNDFGSHIVSRFRDLGRVSLLHLSARDDKLCGNARA